MRQSVAINRDVISGCVGDEEILLHLETGIYYGLDPLGTKIWGLLKENASFKTIHKKLEEEYDVDRKQLGRDLSGFFEKLLQNALVVEQ